MSLSASDLNTLLDYHYWARDRALDAVDRLTADDFIAARGNSFSSIRDTLAHTYFAEWAWYSRWQGHSPTAFPDPAQFATASELREAWRALEREIRAYLEPMADQHVQQVISYRLLTGAEASTPLWQMVQHVVNHASYHRGQITTMLRQAGKEAGKSMDLIAFYRERAAGKA
ncbi:MAG TPA: DinB family protein [Vicinamibacterales bacterium]|nr:DinB family protein [Vicinamibacterales bacterium]